MDRMRGTREFQFVLAPSHCLSRLSISESWRIFELKEIFHLLFKIWPFPPNTHTYTNTQNKTTLN